MRGHGHSDHYLRLRRSYLGELQWTMVSEWDIPDGGRLRRTMHRTSVTTDWRHARRWAKKYGVEFPTEPEEIR
jgi:hypothetical protein